YWQARVPQAGNLLKELVADEHPRVRLEAVRALAQRSSVDALQATLSALDRPVDKLLDYALGLTVRELESTWLPALHDGQLSFDGRERHLIYALEAVGTPAIVPPLTRLVQAGNVPRDREEAAWKLIVAHGGP